MKSSLCMLAILANQFHVHGLEDQRKLIQIAPRPRFANQIVTFSGIQTLARLEHGIEPSHRKRTLRRFSNLGIRISRLPRCKMEKGSLLY